MKIGSGKERSEILKKTLIGYKRRPEDWMMLSPNSITIPDSPNLGLPY